MLLPEETKQKYGYNIIELSQGSKKVVIGKCDICGLKFEKIYYKITSARKRTNVMVDVCKNFKCIWEKQKQSMLIKYGVKNAGQIEGSRDQALKTMAVNYGDGVNIDWDKRFESNRKTCMEKYGVTNVF